MSNRISLAEGQKLLRANAVESEVQSAILEYLRVQKIPHTITEAKQSFNQRGQLVRRINPGWPDITACHSGAMVAIECKRAVGGVLSYDQADTLHRLFLHGALVAVARSVDDVADLLRTRNVSEATKREIAEALAKGPKPKTKGKR